MSVNTWQTPNTWNAASAPSLNINITEVASSAIDSSSMIFNTGELSIVVTEVASSAVDVSYLTAPSTIIINTRNIIRVSNTRN